GHDVDDLAAPLRAELHRPGGEGEQRVVTAPADQVARVELGAALPNQNLASVNNLAAEALHTETFRLGVAAVPRAGRTLLVSHGERLLPSPDPGHLDPGQQLTVPLALVVTGLGLELVNADLRPLDVLGDLAGHRDLGQLCRVGHQLVTVDEEHRRQRHRIAGRAGKLLNLDHVALGNLVLFAAGLDDRVHGTRTPVVDLVTDGVRNGSRR